MKESVEVLIIGAGVIGASVAYHLAQRGCTDVLVIDRGGRPGEGSTSRATGGFRAQFATSINVRMSLLAREKLLRFRDELGVDCGYRACGYLFLATSDREMGLLQSAQRMQHREGLKEAVAVSTEEIAKLNPAIDRSPVVGGAFCPSDGFILPLRILEGYLLGARRLGVRIRFDEACGSFEIQGGRIVETRTSRGNIASRVVVNAAGAWAAQIARLAGVDVPVKPVRRQVAVTVETAALTEDMPMTLYASDGFHFRVREGRVLLLSPSENPPVDSFDTSVDPEWLRQITSLARQRVPLLFSTPLDVARCWAGLYEMSPDKHALLGFAGGVDNLFLVNGSSGHGVMHSPALGQLAAELIVHGRASALDAHCLRPGRFAEGDPNPNTELL